MHRIFLFFLVFISVSVYSQELNCNVVVNAQFTGNENVPVFKTLENQLKEFVNNTKWTAKEYGAM